MLLFTVIVVLGALLAYWLLTQAVIGAGILTAISGYILKLIVKFVFGPIFKSIGTALLGKPKPETEGELLTDEFKASAKGRLAPDMWTDGRRLYFEVGSKSYSVPADLETARKRKNELMAAMNGAKL
jgi:hypothetical protein